MTEPDILALARAAIAELGEKAADVMQQRADAHRQGDELERAEFWQQVADAVRALQRSEGRGPGPAN